MAHAVTKPLVRSDDLRALRFRHRRIALSGNYATNGEVILASRFGLSRIYAVIPLQAIVGAANAVTGELPKFDIAADRRSVNLRLIEDAAGAAGATLGVEKNNAEAYAANSILDVLVLGE